MDAPLTELKDALNQSFLMKLPGRTTLVSGYNAALKKTAGIPVSWGGAFCQ